MKLFAFTAAAMTAASSAIAGSVAYVAPSAPVVIEETPMMGGSGMWLIPLLAIALVALAMSNDSTPPSTPPIR